DEAAAMYRSQAERMANDPVQSGYALQTLANLYQQQHRYTEAAATLKEAINNLETSGAREPQVLGMQRELARTLSQAGQAEAADQIYERLLANESGQEFASSLTAYAAHLAETRRATQAESLLKGYLENHSDLPAYQQASVYFSLANIERGAG